MTAEKQCEATLIARLAVEFLGTFFLLLTISMVVVKAADLSIIAPLPIGVVLLVLVYAGGPISGAHYNPAVTLCLCMTNRARWRDALPYILVQFLGAVIAALVAMAILGTAEQMVQPEVTVGFAAEAIWSFLLVYVILQVTSQRQLGNQWFGFVIGMTVAGGAWAMGPVSGAVFNPAVWFGLAIEHKLNWDHWWLYVFAPITGGVIAVAFDWLTSQTVSEEQH